MRKKIFALLASAAALASCAKELQEGPSALTPQQTLQTKLVGGVTCEGDASSILIFIDGDIRDIVSHYSDRGFVFKPVFRNTASQEAMTHNLHRWYEVSLDGSTSVSEAALLLAESDKIGKIQYNLTMKQDESELIPFEDCITKSADEATVFDDPYFPEQWNLYNDGTICTSAVPGADISVRDAWSLCAGSPDVTVAIIDSGISVSNDDLQNSIWRNETEINGTPYVDDDGNGFVDDKYGYNFIRNNGVINAVGTGESAPGHGTHVAGIIGAESNNGKGISGIAGGTGNNDGVRLMSCQIFEGSSQPTISTIANALIYAADNGAAIASCSFGSPATVGTFYYESDNLYKAQAGVEYDAIQYFISHANCPAVGGNIIVFSTGNDGKGVAGYPGALKDIIGVSAFAPDFLPTSYTNYGPGTNITAPGGDYYADPKAPAYKTMILSTIPNGLTGTIKHPSTGQYGYMQGTSQACPHVSGIAALGMSYALKLGKTFTREQFVSMLLSSTNEMNSRLTGTKITKEIGDVDITLDLRNYYGNLGTGSVDAWKFLMNIEGTPSILTKVGETVEVDLRDYMGGHAADLTYLGTDMDDSTANSLGITESPVVENGILKVTCTRIGSGKITVRAIAGGDTLGGGDSVGGMEFSREVSIVSRPYAAANGGWF